MGTSESESEHKRSGDVSGSGMRSGDKDWFQEVGLSVTAGVASVFLRDLGARVGGVPTRSILLLRNIGGVPKRNNNRLSSKGTSISDCMRV